MKKKSKSLDLKDFGNGKDMVRNLWGGSITWF